MSDPKLHHYIPRFYLANFLGAKKCLWVYDKDADRIFAASPERIAAETLAMDNLAPVFTSLESQRLRLRRFDEADLAPFLAYLNDPLVARYQTWESYTEQQARDVIQKQRNLVPGVPGQWFTFAVESKTAGVLIGHVALKIDDHQQAEIGFTFSRAYQGQGLAYEAATCVLNYAFTNLEIHRVIAITDCENERSVALLSRLGMRREGHFIQNIWFKGKWGDEYLYAVLREEWLRKPAGLQI